MTTRTHSARRCSVLLIAVTATLGATSGAFAADHNGERFAVAAHQHFDTRFSHNHAYFDRGYVVHEPPRTGFVIYRGHDRYWYDRGQWYRPGVRGWVVVGAPVGAFVSVLPPFYSTVWFGGVPYYYADDTYYIWSGAQHQYEVVEPPAGIEASGSTQPPASDQVFIYPKNGQSSEQQARDRYECHHYAVEETGYDPTQAAGGVSPDTAASKRADYFRADAACLDARGYSVK